MRSTSNATSWRSISNGCSRRARAPRLRDGPWKSWLRKDSDARPARKGQSHARGHRRAGNGVVCRRPRSHRALLRENAGLPQARRRRAVLRLWRRPTSDPAAVQTRRHDRADPHARRCDPAARRHRPTAPGVFHLRRETARLGKTPAGERHRHRKQGPLAAGWPEYLLPRPRPASGRTDDAGLLADLLNATRRREIRSGAEPKMKSRRQWFVCFALFLAAGLPAAGQSERANESVDLLLQGGLVVDGSGSAPRAADVG